MKIVIINGSPRHNGSTAYILHMLEKGLLEKDVDVKYYDLSKQDIAICKGCCMCYKLGNCIIEDDGDKISNDIKDADGIIIGTSTMESNVSGILKVFMDRGHFVLEQLLKDKYSISVVTYENYGGKDASKILKKFLSISGAIISGSFCHKVVFNSNLSQDKVLDKKILKISNRLYNDIKYKRRYPRQLIKHKIAFKFGIKPFVLKKGINYSGVINKWKIND